MEQYDSLTEFLDAIHDEPITFAIMDAYVKAWGKIHGYNAGEGGTGKAFTSYPTIMVSVSGGSDSDIMLDMVERIGHPLSDVRYVFFDTGMEFKATKDHLDFLEQKYGIKIERYPAKVPVPIGVKKYGYPFLSKQISQYIHRLQMHGFKWEDRPFEELYEEYPRCKAALRWWCNRWGKNGKASRMDISHTPYLKEFLMSNPPPMHISDGCCNGAKKNTAHAIEKQINPDLGVRGLRKAEGGVRSTAYTTCFDEVWCGCDQYRPIFWFQKADKDAYEQVFGVTHSACYHVYGLRRTGCACCPFGKDFEKELEAVKEHEPNLYAAATHVFAPSYEYTRQYRKFCEERKGNKNDERERIC